MIRRISFAEFSDVLRNILENLRENAFNQSVNDEIFCHSLLF